MIQEFKGWNDVATQLNEFANNPSHGGNRGYSLNPGQCASLRAIAERITNNGMVIADEVGMGKTCIAVELARSVVDSGGRVAILVPPGLGYQWQDELRKGDVDAPLILRSLYQYLSAWAVGNQQQPWFQKPVVVISHAFTNWRLGERSEPWRWALLPELYARWRQRTSTRLPRGYNNNNVLNDLCVRNAAVSICNEIPEDEQHIAWQLMNSLSDKTPWPAALQPIEYRRNNNLRPCLEGAVGLGLGIFDLVIIDEAHKSRGAEAGLSRLLDVILQSESGRRFAMTATPVELDITQWKQTLGRIGVDDQSLSPIKQDIESYSNAVKRVCQCPSSEDARKTYAQSAENYQKSLSPYLLRRDKREDFAVKSFAEYSCLPIQDYRRETEISIETEKLSLPWNWTLDKPIL